MRDCLKDVQYFNEFLEEEEARIQKFQAKLDNNEVKADRILPVMSKIHNMKLGVLIAKYSKGENTDDLIQNYNDLIEKLPEVWEPDFYIKNLWLISIGIMLDTDNSMLDIIRKLVVKSEKNDWLYNFLFEYKSNNIEDIAGELEFPQEYQMLYEIAISEEERSKRLEEYIENIWYNAHKDCGWYDSHKNKQKLYFGYWSFESGAMAKILGIDDDKLKNVPYYPYDLVHYKK